MSNEINKYTSNDIVMAIVKILLMFAALYAAYEYIDNRIDKKINSPEFIQKIASNVRPSVIFNSQESIEIDMGAMQFIDNIKVIPSDDSRFPKEIIISPNRYFAHAPFLSPLDRVEFYVQAERGKKYDWIYQLVVSKYPTHIDKSRFRLEIIQ